MDNSLHRLSPSREHIKAVLEALLVTFLWSTSWVLIKYGLQTSLPALTFAGLRYSLAFLCLAPIALVNPARRQTLRSMPRLLWAELAFLGLVFYTLTHGAQFVGLVNLPAATLTLLLNFSPILVALSSGLLNHEPPSISQWLGIALSILGALVYFLPIEALAIRSTGLMVALTGLLANALSSLLGRRVNAQSGLPPILITTISMGIGGIALLVLGAGIQGFGHLDFRQWSIIGWLAVVNTAVAFTLWNHSLRTLTAIESSIINNTMLPQIAILAWLFLGEALTSRQVIGMLLVAAGTLVVQVGRRLLDNRRTSAGKPD